HRSPVTDGASPIRTTGPSQPRGTIDPLNYPLELRRPPPPIGRRGFPPSPSPSRRDGIARLPPPRENNWRMTGRATGDSVPAGDRRTPLEGAWAVRAGRGGARWRG